MTNDEKLDRIYEAIIKIEPMVKGHNDTLYGNGRPGLCEDVLILNQQQENCPARKAASSGNKRLNIAVVMMVIAIIGLLASVAIGVIGIVK